MKKLIALATIILALISTANAASPVWRVSKGSTHLYIGGTVHLLSKKDYPLPQAFEKAYNDSQVICFEVDISKINTIEFAQKLMVKNMYLGDDDITKHLKPETVERLKEFLQSKNMPLDGLKKMKPGFLVLMLTTTEMQRLGMGESGVDQFYSDKAVKDKKRISALETADAQIELISNMGAGNEDDLIIHMIEELHEIVDVLDETKTAWRKGDLTGLELASLDSWKDDFPELYKELVVDRNNNWIPQIKDMLKSKEVEFVLVGALHLSGRPGVLAQLRKAGFTVKQLN